MAPEFLPGNRLTLLNSGDEYFPVLLAEIESARQEIYLESYIFADDEIGHEVTGALCRAAQRGVQVNVTVDGFGGRNFDDDFLPRLSEAGVRAMLYRPERSLFRLRRHRLRRLHRKLVVIDTRLAFVGGINVVDDNNAPLDMRPRYDYAVRIEGPTVRQVHEACRHLWEVVAWVSFRRRFRLGPPAAPCCEQIGTQKASFLIRDNLRHRNDILNAYIEAIESARSEILIANAYVLPGVRFGLALQAAARRGVKIVLLLQGKTDHPMLRFATQSMYKTALQNGIRIFEYEKSFMHAKVAVIDGEWATVGSSNIDPFSLLLAKEANLVIRDRGFAQELKTSIESAMQAGAREIVAEELSRHSWPKRVLRLLSYSLVRALVGLTGYGPRRGQADEEAPGASEKSGEESRLGGE